jgi:hypothetical protein
MGKRWPTQPIPAFRDPLRCCVQKPNDAHPDGPACCAWERGHKEPGHSWAPTTLDRLLAIEAAARAFEQGLDAQDLPEEKRMQLLALRVALARET